MGLIKNQLVLTDGMTQPLRSINKAVNMVLNSFESMQRATGKPIDTKAIHAVKQELAKTDAMLKQVENQTKRNESAADAYGGTLMRVAGALGAAFSVSKIIQTADAMTTTRARLNLITGDLEKTAALQDQIMASAFRSRASYQGTADAVAKMGIMAKDAFANTDELVAFTELINKQFTISGASAEGQRAAMLQLTQAMASGVLRGEELNSIFEQAPTIIQTVADYMGVPIGAIRQMAQEGQITAQVVKDAMLASSGEINAQFEAMPYTYAQVGTLIGNIAMQTFEPVLQVIGTGAQFIVDHWSTIEPVLIGVGSAALVVAGAFGMWRVATMLQTLATNKLFIALLHNPMTWIVLGIGLVVGAIAVWIHSLGGLRNAWEVTKLTFAVGWAAIKLGFFSSVYFVLDLADKMRVGWHICTTAIANFTGDMKVKVLMIMQDMVNGGINIINSFIKKLNAIPGISIGFVDHVTFGAAAAIANRHKKAARNAELANYKAAVTAGMAERDAKLAGLHSELDTSMATLRATKAQYRDEKAQGTAMAGMPSLGEDMALDELGTISDNTGSTAAALHGLKEDLRYMRDLAEQEIINRFTTAEVKVDFSGMTNRIDSTMDIDGVINRLTDGLAEALVMTAEGVHA